MTSTGPRPAPSDIISALSISGLSLSPSGTHAVYCTEPYGKTGKHPLSTLWLAEPGKANSSRQLTSGLYNDRSPCWSPDGNAIAFLSNRKDEESCAVYLLDLNTSSGEPVPITDVQERKGIGELQWSRSGKFLAFTSADETFAEDEKRKERKEDWDVLGERLPYQRLRVVDVSKRETRTLLQGDYHVAAFAWSPDDSEMIVLTQDRPGPECSYSDGQTFRRITVAEGTSKEIAHFPGNAGGTAGLSWVKQDEMWFVAKYPAGALESSDVVYRLSFTEKKLTRRACGQEDSAGDLRVHTGSQTVYVKRSHKLDEDIFVIGESGVQEKVYGGMHEITAWDARKKEDGSHVAVYTFSDFMTPPEVFSFDAASDTATQLSAHSADVFTSSKGTYSTHQLICKTPSASPDTSESFAAENTTFELQGLLVSPQPESASPTARPTVVLVHGGPYFSATTSFLAPHQPWPAGLLATGSYNLLLPNYRGGSGQGRAFASSIRGRAGTIDYDDCLAMIDEGIAQGWVDTGNIVFAGWSWGGMLGYLATVRNGTDSFGREKEWRFRGAICGAGAVDGDMMAMLSDLYTTRKVYMGALPWTSYEDNVVARKCSAIWQLKKAVEEKRVPPVLILHGAADPRVVPENSHAFKRALDHYGLPCEAVLYPREEHIFVERASNIDMLERVLAFCARVLDVSTC